VNDLADAVRAPDSQVSHRRNVCRAQEAVHRIGHQHLSGTSRVRELRRQGHGRADVAAFLTNAFAGVNRDPHANLGRRSTGVVRVHAADDRHRGSDGFDRRSEGRVDRVPDHLLQGGAASAANLAPDESSRRFQEASSRSIAFSPEKVPVPKKIGEQIRAQSGRHTEILPPKSIERRDGSSAAEYRVAVPLEVLG
jgi:hypothetical protein